MRSLIAVLLLGATGLAQAAGSYPWYFGLRIGDDLDKRLPAGPGDLDSQRIFGAYGGYHFKNGFGIEVGLNDTGNTTRSGILDAGLDVEGNLYSVGGTYSREVAPHFSLFGGAGLFRLEEDGTSITIAGPRPLDLSETGFYLEAGGVYVVNDFVGLRASYQWFDFDEDSDGTPFLGAEIHF